LDDKTDRFTSSREGIVADDPKFKKFLERFRKLILTIVEDWDDWRIKRRDEGDPENKRLSKKDRASFGLYGAVSKEYDLPVGSKNKSKIDGWVSALSSDAAFNFSSYAECFVSENLIRNYIREKKIRLSPEAKDEIKKWKNAEVESKNRGNISIGIRRKSADLSYLSMNHLANLVDKKDKIKEASLARDADTYKPVRDAVAHTALLSDLAKKRLTTVYENIKGRIKALLKTA